MYRALNDKFAPVRSMSSVPKFRSGETGMIVSEVDTRCIIRAIGKEGISILVEQGFLIEDGLWPEVVDSQSWQDLCENGFPAAAMKKFKDDHNCTLSEARDAIENYREYLKKKYCTRKGGF